MDNYLWNKVIKFYQHPIAKKYKDAFFEEILTRCVDLDCYVYKEGFVFCTFTDGLVEYDKLECVGHTDEEDKACALYREKLRLKFFSNRYN